MYGNLQCKTNQKKTDCRKAIRNFKVARPGHEEMFCVNTIKWESL